MRASQPRADGYVERHGVKTAPFEILAKNVNALGDPAVTVSSFPAQNAIKTPNTRTSRAAHVQARRTVPTSICPVKVEESHQT